MNFYDARFDPYTDDGEPPADRSAMSEQETEERTSIDQALEAWEQRGPTSLTVALVTDALYGARDRLAAVEALADEPCENYDAPGQDCITAGPQVFQVEACTPCRVRAALAASPSGVTP